MMTHQPSFSIIPSPTIHARNAFAPGSGQSVLHQAAVWFFALAIMLLTGGRLVQAQVCAPQPAGAVSWWPAEGHAHDIKDGNHGVLQNGATFAGGKVGQAFSFDGVDDYVLIGNPANLRLQDFTISVWVRRASTSLATLSPGVGDQGAIFAFGLNGYALALQPTGELMLTKVGVSHVQTSALKVNDTNWHHIAVTKSAGTVAFYVDGAEEVVAFTYNPGFNFTTNAAIGVRGDDLKQGFWGLLDELAIYNRALSLGEIQGTFNAGSAGNCPLVDPCQQSLAAALQQIQADLRATFDNPQFTIPGATPLEQLQSLKLALLSLEKGRKEGIYANLGGKP